MRIPRYYSSCGENAKHEICTANISHKTKKTLEVSKDWVRGSFSEEKLARFRKGAKTAHMSQAGDYLGHKERAVGRDELFASFKDKNLNSLKGNL